MTSSMVDWTKICCAVDFSAPSDRALQAAADLARRLDVELLLLHVAERGDVGVRLSSGEVRDTVAAKAAEERAALSEWRRRAAELVHRDVDAVVVTGAPAAEIISFARRVGCGLLVLGTHGRTRLRRAVFGSVAEQVVRQAPCPVLTVRPSEEASPARTIAGVV
jgi:nucleotide-binding universal stress UspA family protein